MAGCGLPSCGGVSGEGRDLSARTPGPGWSLPLMLPSSSSHRTSWLQGFPEPQPELTRSSPPSLPCPLSPRGRQAGRRLGSSQSQRRIVCWGGPMMAGWGEAAGSPGRSAGRILQGTSRSRGQRDDRWPTQQSSASSSSLQGKQYRGRGRQRHSKDPDVLLLCPLLLLLTATRESQASPQGQEQPSGVCPAQSHLSAIPRAIGTGSPG